MARETSSTIFKDLVNSPVGIIAEYIVNRLAIKSGYSPLKEFISEIQTGKTPPMNNPEYYSSNDMEWIKPSDIGFEKYITASDWISNIAVKTNKATIYKPNTILIICIGGGIGRLGIVNKLCSSNQQITGVLFKDNVIPEYAYYFFLSRYKIFEANSSKSTLPIINQKGLGNLDFLCPKVDVQKEIVKYLDYCKDCLIGNNYPINKKFYLESEILSFAIRAFKAYYTQKELLFEYQNQLTQLTNLNQAILQEAVQGKLAKQDKKDEPATELLKRIKAEKAKSGKKEKPLPPINSTEIPFEIPESWVWCRLGEMSINRDGERKPIAQSERNGRKKIYDYYGASGVIDKIDGYTHEGELLLIGEDGANLIARSTPIAFIAKGQFWVNNHAHVIDTVDRITLDYLCCFINSMDLKPFVTGGFQPKLSQGNLNIIPVPLPPLAEQKRIVAEIEKQLDKTKKLKEHIIANQQATEQLLKALLHQAFEVEKMEEV